jgi:G3E family GTPase
MNQSPLPITVLSGFKGAGKTTLADALLANAEGVRIGAVTWGKEAGPAADRETTELPNGGLLLTLSDQSMQALEGAITWLAGQQRFDAIVIETSGIADPLTIAEELAFGDDNDATLAGQAHLDTFVTVIDAARFLSDYMSSDSLAERGLHTGDHHGEDRTVVETLIGQIEFCDVIVINKSDLVDANEMEKIAHILHGLNPRAHQIKTESGIVSPEEILNTGRFDFDATASAPGWLAILNGEAPASDEPDSFGVGHFVYRARRPFHPERLWNLLHQEWPGVLRAKGFFWLATRGEVGGSLSQAGGTCRHGPAGVWWAAQDRSEWPTDDPELEAEIVAEWYGEPDDNRIGDRRQELVLIGLDLDPAAWQDTFDACLLTDEEWSLGADGWTRFTDPFPVWEVDDHEHEHGPDCDCDDHWH